MQNKIIFEFTGEPFPSFEEQNQAKNMWFEKLGPFREEFEEKGGWVIFNYSYPETSNDRISFGLGNGYSNDEFIFRWNEYIRSIESDTDDVT